MKIRYPLEYFLQIAKVAKTQAARLEGMDAEIKVKIDFIL